MDSTVEVGADKLLNQQSTVSYPIPKLKTLLRRGWQKKCPQCGQGALYRRWLTLHDRCSVCGLQYTPNQGDLWGALMFLDRVLFIIPLIVLIYFRVWHPNLMVFLIFGGAMTFALIFTMPHRNGVCLAFDYLIRRKSGDLSDQDSPEQPEKGRDK